jgi:hypothetical protein
LKVSEALSPFYIGYGYEALARAARTLGNESECAHHLAEGKSSCEAVTDAQDKELLSADLTELSS